MIRNCFKRHHTGDRLVSRQSRPLVPLHRFAVQILMKPSYCLHVHICLATISVIIRDNYRDFCCEVCPTASILKRFVSQTAYSTQSVVAGQTTNSGQKSIKSINNGYAIDIVLIVIRMCFPLQMVNSTYQHTG